MCFVPNFLQFRSYSEEVLHFCLLAKLQQDVMCSSKSMIQSLLPLMKLYTQYPREMQLKAVEGQSAAQAPRQVGISTAWRMPGSYRTERNWLKYGRSTV